MEQPNNLWADSFVQMHNSVIRLTAALHHTEDVTCSDIIQALRVIKLISANEGNIWPIYQPWGERVILSGAQIEKIILLHPLWLVCVLWITLATPRNWCRSNIVNHVMGSVISPLVAPAAPRWQMAPRTSQKALCSSPLIPRTFMAACSLENCCEARCLSSVWQMAHIF